MRRQRRHSIAFKRQVVEERHAGAALLGLAEAHDVCRDPIWVRIDTNDADEFDDEIETAETRHAYGARIAAPAPW